MNKDFLRLIRRICYRHSDNEYVQALLDYQANYKMIHFQHNVNAEIADRVYHIYVGTSSNGFFATYRDTLDLCYFAKTLGLKPIIEWSRTMQYAEDGEFMGTCNPFEYYYVQPTDYSIGDLQHISIVFDSETAHRTLAEQYNTGNMYQTKNDYVVRMADIQREYFCLRPEIMSRLECEMGALFSKEDKVLGVHFRGTDFKSNFKNHPAYISEEMYVDAIDNSLETYDKIFLATDDDEAAQFFKNRYGDHLVNYDDTVRGTTRDSVMYTECNREHNNFELGYEVLRDAWTLANCKGLIAGMSQVSICARIMKYALDDHGYKDERILSNTINARGKIYRGR